MIVWFMWINIWTLYNRQWNTWSTYILNSYCNFSTAKAETWKYFRILFFLLCFILLSLLLILFSILFILFQYQSSPRIMIIFCCCCCFCAIHSSELDTNIVVECVSFVDCNKSLLSLNFISAWHYLMLNVYWITCYGFWFIQGIQELLFYFLFNT